VNRCQKLVAEARGQFGNPEEVERPPLEAVIRQRLVKAQKTEKSKLCAVVNYRVCELAITL
jgi:hypothetical protein